ncbi:MAG TPA: aspartate racemase, partial [Candidatus Competibacteraceae bacterium]|nr:aspartate racemase [Candidatus Competibacteraceae bacterium]
RLIDKLKTQGAEAIILGCTEISLLVSSEDSSLPLFDTTALHAQKAAEWALSP